LVGLCARGVRREVGAGQVGRGERSRRGTRAGQPIQSEHGVGGCGQARPLELVSVTPAKTGVLICAYRRVRD
jgi:hypothetical protein